MLLLFSLYIDTNERCFLCDDDECVSYELMIERENVITSFEDWCGITGGKLVIEVTYFGWHIHSETHDLCSETTCPAETGDFLVAHSQVLPGYTPPVSLMIHFVSWFLLFSLKR
ncbi:hypothetical protein F2Q69_00062821 [Brassica cretica]|uniref:MD-2-related lipid-recognition domain-containing protein n=1 Tax=Brassica cretica TaxID=69181 RepID=A0A8S9RSW4_BRACR|nr:hypothetical protein F2Q69_00062821 [Brassica cretica]